MPTLKQLTCSVEWQGTDAPLQEFQTTYSDGYVETYLAVPETPSPFMIHLRSNGYIAPGLSMFVFMDGVYQCNRNRQNLKLPDEHIPKEQAEIDFRVRQQEQILHDGTFVGRPWEFNKVNVVSNSNVNVNERAPYNGEYVGTIEVVVLRCCPRIPSHPSLDSSVTLVNSNSPISSDQEADDPKILTMTKLKEDANTKSKDKRNPKSRTKTKSRPFGLDGSFDDFDPPASVVEKQKEVQHGPREWGSPPPPAKKQEVQHSPRDWAKTPSPTKKPEAQYDPWDWGKMPSPAEKYKAMQNEPRDWLNPPSTTVKQKEVHHGPWDWGKLPSPAEKQNVEHDPWDWGKPPSLTGSPTDASRKGWANPQPSKEKPKMGTVEMTSANAGIYRPVNGSEKTASQAGSRAGSQRGSQIGQAKIGTVAKTSSDKSVYHFVHGSKSTSSQTGSQAGSQAGPRKGSQRAGSEKTISVTGQESPASIHLRGGGPSSHSVRSHHSSGRRSPLVVNNSIVYNGVGTPPPLSSGPQPARKFWTDMAAAAPKSSSQIVSKQSEASDAWGGGGAYHATKDPTANFEAQAKDKVDSWNAGGSDMPGAWDTTNDQKTNDDVWGTSGDKHQAENDVWPDPVKIISSKDDSQDSQDNAFDNAGQSRDWNEAKDDTQRKENDWNGNDDQVSKNGDDWGSKANIATQQDNRWGTSSQKDTKQDDTRGTRRVKSNQQKPQEPGPATPGSLKQPWPTSTRFAKPDSVIKAGTDENQASLIKPQAKSSFFGWLGGPNKKESQPPASAVPSRKESTPGSCGPPLRSSFGSSSKRAVPAFTQAQAQTILQTNFSSSTTPQAKFYWSNWRDPRAHLTSPDDDGHALPKAEPLYSIPENLAQRDNTSHQVRHGLPSRYTHKVSRPKYIDSHEIPYAVFIFKYRSKYFVEQMLNTSIMEPEVDEKQRLFSLPKDQLVEELIKAKSQSGSNGVSNSHRSSDKGTFKSNPHGVPLGPSASTLTEKLNKLERSKPPTPEKVGGWLESANGNERGNGRGECNGQPNAKANDNVSVGNQWGTSEEKRDNSGEDTWDINDSAQINEGDHAGGDTWNNDEDKNEEDDKEDAGSWGATGFGGQDTSWGKSENGHTGHRDADDRGDDAGGNENNGGDAEW